VIETGEVVAIPPQAAPHILPDIGGAKQTRYKPSQHTGRQAIVIAIDGHREMGGEAEFIRCVAHNNAGQGFSLLTSARLTECGSFGNGEPHDVGQRTPTKPARVDANVRRVGAGGYGTIEEAIEAADAGDIIEIEPGE
jgi:hypothetical protein